MTTKKTTTKKKAAAKLKKDSGVINPVYIEESEINSTEAEVQVKPDLFKTIYGSLEAIQVPGGCIVKCPGAFGYGLCFVPKVKLANTGSGKYELVDGR